MYRKSIGAIVYRKTSKGNRFLIFHRKLNWKGWEMLKGGIKDSETEIESLKREIKEETGIQKYTIIKKTGKIIKYKWPKEFIKDNHAYRGAKVTFYLIKTSEKNIKIDRTEHDGYQWLSGEEALKLLTYNNHKRILKHVIEKGDIL